MQTRKENIKGRRVLSSAGDKAIIELGVDILERKRIKKAISRHSDRFLKKIYTPNELKKFPENKELYYSIGFSLKEAFWKTLHPDIQKKTYFGDIEIIWNKKNPEIFLSGKKVRCLQVSYFFNKKLVLGLVVRPGGKQYG